MAFQFIHMGTIASTNIKNQYLWGLMKVKKNTRPYYAKWWFFLSLIALGWITPITKHWQLFILGETAPAFVVQSYNGSLIPNYQFVFIVNGYHYVSSYKLDLGERPPRDEVTIFYEADSPNENFCFDLEQMYSNENFFFPVGLQIGLGVFFLLIRFKELD